MGILQCRDSKTPTPTKGQIFKFHENKCSGLLSAHKPPKSIHGPDNLAKGSGDASVVIKNDQAQTIKCSELEEEARDTVGSNPIKIPNKTTPFSSSLKKANSYPTGIKLVGNPMHRRENSAPVALSIYYSLAADNLNEQSIQIDESVIEDLISLKPRTISMSQRFQIRRKSSNLGKSKLDDTKKPKKKVRFDDNVTIHRIEASTGVPSAMPETYKLVVTLRQVWKQLDLDQDKYLNITELRRFCGEVWEEPDSDVYEIMKLYAQEKPEKGINFNEWCSLIKDEDPELKELVEDLYTIFVQDSDDE